jgi:phosphonate transport system substrate-binding protein
MFAQKHDNVVTMVYQGQVDAGATYYSSPEDVEKNGKKMKEIRDARYRVMTQFPDVEQKVKIIAFTDEVPNEPWVVRTNLYKDPAKSQQVIRLLKEGIASFIQTEQGRKALWTVSTAKNLVPTAPGTYDRVRELILESGTDVQAVMMKKSKKKK